MICYLYYFMNDSRSVVFLNKKDRVHVILLDGIAQGTKLPVETQVGIDFYKSRLHVIDSQHKKPVKLNPNIRFLL